MTDTPKSPQLPPLTPPDSALQLAPNDWFEYPVVAHPHHTDYSGGAWHGAYIAWMEEARVECLRRLGIEFATLVALGCDLPVVELAIRYHQAIRMGERAVVRTRMVGVAGVRINWDYQIQAVDTSDLFVTARVTLVAVDREKGKIMRQLPPALKDALAQLAAE